ncbi:MAG: bifunctional adenosylcobinamide kinase/adenosylcobinamide-phosphate guanylyltransferase [Deltaproteobacteria bacterium]|nr:bifunctional adenosylcobinamide kinase/adenosylcobinamide-phosphate guanylyltransferase [Deltaproteobacteria bacterium]MBW2014300.1 bifunctional adenosylcobinamide kinase/adenosylcobinamide-phosphate guanylyltransferase [Deltaproteobacteria bacterium]
MKETVLVIGGCRSGKSGYALELAEKIPGQKIFIATCIPHDKEMEDRVLHHKKQRSRAWTTREVPIRLPEAIRKNSRKENVILVDCLTLWISNLFLEDNDQENIDGHIRKLIQSLEKAECPIILVSNEVGTGIVPENRLARRFRDIAGFTNQRVAACVNKVIWMVAGIPVGVKNPGPEDQALVIP